jgi:predicted amidohydrolase
MRVHAIQFDIAWEDKPANHAVLEARLDAADPPAGSFVVLPELADTGFSFDLDRIVDDATLDWARRTARGRGIWLQAGFARRGPDGRGRNCAAIVSPDGDLAGVYEKVHPFSYGRESEHFGGGSRLVLRSCGGAVVCPLVCYDLRFPELWRLAAAAGAEVFTLGANWPSTRQTHWRQLVIARAIENLAYVVAVNRVGTDPNFAFGGGSLVVGPSGDVLAEAGDADATLSADLDLEALRAWRSEFPALRDMRPELLGSISLDASPPPADAAPARG